MARIGIKGDGTVGNTKIFLNDTDVSNYVTRIRIDTGVANRPIAYLDCIGTIEWSGEFAGDATIFFAQEPQEPNVYRRVWMRVEKWLKKLKS